MNDAVWLILILPIALYLVSRTSCGCEPRIRRLQAKLDYLAAHLKVEYNDPLELEIRPLIASGEKIEAIKRVRERTGMGLKEAKDYVESLPTSSGGFQNG
jgi:hypothetical protein